MAANKYICSLLLQTRLVCSALTGMSQSLDTLYSNCEAMSAYTDVDHQGSALKTHSLSPYKPSPRGLSTVRMTSSHLTEPFKLLYVI